MSTTALLDGQLTRLQESVGELLLEQRAGDTPRRSFKPWRDDPAGFAIDVLGMKRWNRQLEIAEAVRDHEMTAVLSANGIGKDAIATATMLWWVYARKGLVLGTAPTDRQAGEVIAAELRRHMLAGQLPGTLLSRALRTSHSHAGILLLTSADASKLTGFHSPRVLWVGSEAQGLEALSFEAALAVCVGEEDRLLAMGNPIRPAGTFWKITRPKSQWHVIQISALEHPNVTSGQTLIPGAVTRKAVERAKREWGVESNAYVARVLGQFPTESEEGLVKRSWLDASVDRWAATMVAGVKGGTVDAALDVARGGPDRSCLGLMQGRTVLGFTTWGQLDTMETAERVLEVLRVEGWPSYPAKDLLYLPLGGRHTRLIRVDTIGVGGGPYDRLKQLGHRVESFNGASTPADGVEAERFANERAAAFWRIRERLERGTLDLPPDEELFEELLAMTFTTTAVGGKIIMAPKDGLRGELGRSPDKADTLSMLLGPPQGVAFTSSRMRTA